MVHRRRQPRVDYLGAVREFHRAFGIAAPNSATGIVADAVRKSREALMREELRELINAMSDEEVVAIADGLADLLYVVFGTAVAYGIPIDDVFAEVHESNMTKLDEHGRPVVGKDGKRLKGPFYRPPDIESLLSA